VAGISGNFGGSGSGSRTGNGDPDENCFTVSLSVERAYKGSPHSERKKKIPISY
jgi:hypothetical protein